jgi:broad specificity phosphatase PhoE
LFKNENVKPLNVKPSQTTTRFGVIRHAVTTWNQAKRIQGHIDTPLAWIGKNQAREWGRLLKPYAWHRILSSDLRRSRDTAEILNAYLKVPVDREAKLREQHWGRWVGMTVEQIRNEVPRDFAQQEANGWRFQPPDGENRETVFQRSRCALHRAAEKWPGQTILVVTHEGVLKCLMYRLFEQNRSFTEFTRLQPYRLHWLVHDGTRLYIEKVNALELPGGL